ncbi:MULTISPECIES: DUF3824 domain-containing protein [unclassified Microbacterium]|uniref:DUF3824 domain-containing protein n=1 Tax=unclassified Microbacterium TaxID=2609290 RepID=UPI0012F79AC9|nr:DUF3824 domain-containing protein [Microbacterium sp. Root1433D1]
MDDVPWTQIVTASATLIAGASGYLLGGINEARRDRRMAVREREARAEDRDALATQKRHEFQLKTLLELQDAIQQMARLTGRAMFFDHMQAREGKQTQLPSELSDAMHVNGVDVNRLRTRLLDTELRAAVDSFRSASIAASLDPGVYEGRSGNDVENAAFARSSRFAEHVERMMDELGAALRTELEWTPTPPAT